jgi:hypothetical protein
MTKLQKWTFAMFLLAVGSIVATPAVAQNGNKLQTGSGLAIPVDVVNAPSVSVNNTPNVNITNTPRVDVANTPNVNVANTPTVTLSSNSSLPVTNPPDNQGNPAPLATLEAVQIYNGGTCIIFFNGGNGGTCNFTTVPEGKELYIQEFDESFGVETGNRPLFILLQGTVQTFNFFPYTFLVNSLGFDFIATHQETRLYVAPSQTLLCVVELPQNSNGSGQCEISGFLVDVPEGGSPAVAPAQTESPLLRLRRLLGAQQPNTSGH